MARKRKKRKHLGNYIIMTTTLVLINCLGVSYAYWSSGINITSTVNTGFIDSLFTKDILINTQKGNSSLAISFDDDYSMRISGEVETGFQGSINYGVKNSGSIPIKFDAINSGILDGLSIQLNQLTSDLNPNESLNIDNGNPNIQIIADKEGAYGFQFEIPYKQWNK